MYTQYYSNSKHNSFIDAVPTVNGELAWKLELPSQMGKETANRLILSDGDQYYVDALTEIICVDNNGKELWRKQKWYGSPIVYNEGLIYYQSSERKDDLEAVDTNNKLVISKYPIQGVIEESYLVLFQPNKKELIAQVQYADLPEVSIPEFTLFKSDENSLGFTWHKRFNNEINSAIPFVNFEHKFILTFTQSEGHIFHLSGKKDSVEPDYSFELPKDKDALFASSSNKGEIFLTWSKGNKISLLCLNNLAEENFKIEFENEFVGSEPIVHPPIITSDGYIFVLTGNKIFCVNQEKVIWQKAINHAEYATAFADNSVVIAAGNKLIYLDAQGEEKFVHEIEEKISAPIILNQNGGFIFSTNNIVYSLD
jgi:hypothetical protein